jgi:hypothetical protein
MRLLGSLLHKNVYHALLAEVDVQDEKDEKADEETIRRQIRGRVKEYGPLWEHYLRFWEHNPLTKPLEADGVQYFAVRDLQVDYDLYNFFSWMNVERDVLRLLLTETFYESLDEWREALRERNQRVQDYIDQVSHGEITPNLVRTLMGRPAIANPQLDQPVPAPVADEYRKRFLDPNRPGNPLRNVIV